MQMQPNNRPALIPLISPKETLKIASREAESGTQETLGYILTANKMKFGM